MTRRRFLALFGGLAAAVLAPLSFLKRRKPEVLYTMDVGATRMNDGVVKILHDDEGITTEQILQAKQVLDRAYHPNVVWDGEILFNNDTIMNGVLIKAGTTYKVSG